MEMDAPPVPGLMTPPRPPLPLVDPVPVPGPGSCETFAHPAPITATVAVVAIRAEAARAVARDEEKLSRREVKRIGWNSVIEGVIERKKESPNL
jgi:hypothetical protein